MRTNPKRIGRLVRELLRELGQDPRSPRLRATPEKVAASFELSTSGYGVKGLPTTVPLRPGERPHQLTVVRGIEFVSTCEHHLLPFFGRCQVGYLPRRRAIEESEVARVVDGIARRLQLQERITEQVAAALFKALRPEGLAVAIEARHFCMMMRGVQQQNSSIQTSVVLGALKDSQELRREFLAVAFGAR